MASALRPRCHYGPYVKTCDEGYPSGKGALTCISSLYELYLGANHNQACRSECSRLYQGALSGTL